MISTVDSTMRYTLALSAAQPRSLPIKKLLEIKRYFLYYVLHLEERISCIELHM